jgi:hypothetical protein
VSGVPTVGAVSSSSKPFGRASRQPPQLWFDIVAHTAKAYLLLSKFNLAVDDRPFLSTQLLARKVAVSTRTVKLKGTIEPLA